MMSDGDVRNSGVRGLIDSPHWGTIPRSCDIGSHWFVCVVHAPVLNVALWLQIIVMKRFTRSKSGCLTCRRRKYV